MTEETPKGRLVGKARGSRSLAHHIVEYVQDDLTVMFCRKKDYSERFQAEARMETGTQCKPTVLLCIRCREKHNQWLAGEVRNREWQAKRPVRESHHIEDDEMADDVEKMLIDWFGYLRTNPEAPAIGVIKEAVINFAVNGRGGAYMTMEFYTPEQVKQGLHY